MPESRPKKLSAVRSAVRIGRNGPVTSITVMPASSTLPSAACQISGNSGLSCRKVSVAQARPARTPGWRDRERELCHRPVGDERGGQIALGQQILGQGPGDRLGDGGGRRSVGGGGTHRTAA